MLLCFLLVVSYSLEPENKDIQEWLRRVHPRKWGKYFRLVYKAVHFLQSRVRSTRAKQKRASKQTAVHMAKHFLVACDAIQQSKRQNRLVVSRLTPRTWNWPSIAIGVQRSLDAIKNRAATKIQASIRLYLSYVFVSLCVSLCGFVLLLLLLLLCGFLLAPVVIGIADAIGMNINCMLQRSGAPANALEYGSFPWFSVQVQPGFSHAANQGSAMEAPATSFHCPVGES